MIQEPFWFFTRHIFFHKSKNSQPIFSTFNHPVWLQLIQLPSHEGNKLCTITYINSRLAKLQFFLRKDIFNHYDIDLVSFFNRSQVYFLLNIYFNKHQTTLRYLKNIEFNINNILI